MSKPKKRTYNNTARKAQSQATKKRILDAAKSLFESKGFEFATIEEIAEKAEVSAPAIYAIFQSKRGILLAFLDEALSPERFESLVNQVKAEQVPHKRLKITASIARQLYDAEKKQLNLIRGAVVLDPVFKELEKEREERRYLRQEETLAELARENAFKEHLSFKDVRDILWAFTGRDMYRLLVVERGWTSDQYEQWLAEFLIQNLLRST